MPRVFICVENPASVLGDKSGNVRPSKRHEKKKKVTRQKEEQWTMRQNLLDDENIDVEGRYDGSRDAEATYVRELVAVKKDMTYASTGSLPTMLQELKFAAEKGGPFDTIIFMGHGSPGSMSTGDGKMPTLPEPGQASTRKKNNMLEAYAQDKRVIGTDNAQTWASTFATIATSLTTGAQGRLHIFLLGCSTGLPWSNTTLQQTVATTLRTSCGMHVAAYATSADIGIDQTKEVLENLNSIEKAAQNGGAYALKTAATNIVCSFS